MAYNVLNQHDADLDSDDDDDHDVKDPSIETQTTAMFPALPQYSELASTEHAEMESPITRSREGSIPMRHPTPDLQSLQGAYQGNIERLEQSAERLSLSSSDIGEEIRKIGNEQRRSESRRSSTQNWYRSEGMSSPASQRQISHGQTSHASNSIVETNNVARSGGFSPAGYYASPRGSIRSGSWSHHNSVKERSVSQGARLTQLTEPEQEAQYPESPLSASFAPHTPPSESVVDSVRSPSKGTYNLNDIEIPTMQPVEPESNVAPANETENFRTSTETYRQGGVDRLFSDFDGIHTDPLPDDTSTANGQPAPSRRASRALDVAPHPEDMVFYPAPVPMMLNIPTRLSKQPQAPLMEKRRSELLGGLSREARKSAAWLPEMNDQDDQNLLSDDKEARRRTQVRDSRKPADLPPQLRASMFFDYPSTRHDIQVTGQSAVSTLDSILDAATFAPVSAFTDHPIIGQMGPEAYGKPVMRPRTSTMPVQIAEIAKRRSSLNLLRKRNSSVDLLNTTGKRNSSILSLGNFGRRKSSGPALEDAKEQMETQIPDVRDEMTHSSYHEGGGLDLEYGDEHDSNMEINGQLKEGNPEGGYSSQPSTLLAELQLRKEQLKGRTRTAATAFPDGMHSTLLQLDTIAHMQKQSRKQKHTHLAWEDPTMLHPGTENEDDEDVPLGMLYAGRQMDNREKARRLDEDRPLGLIARREMEDNEPLSHRRARLRGEDISIVGDSFAQGQGMNSIDLPDLQAQPAPVEEEDEHANETLAQRARRLKATKIPTQPRPVSGDFASEMMSQIGGLSLAEQPAATEQATDRALTKTPDLGAAEETLGERRKRLQAAAATTQPLEPNPTTSKRRSMADILQVHPAAGAGVKNLHNEVKYTPGPRTRNTVWAQNVNRQAGLAIGVNAGYHYQGGDSRVNPAINRIDYMQELPSPDQGNVRQNDMVDRWRQSIMYGV